MSTTIAPLLHHYLEQVDHYADDLIRAPELHPSQQDLLRRVVRSQPARAADPWANPVALPYLIARAWGRDPDEQTVHIGAFCLLYALSADLFDDVQDHDLAGKPHEGVGVPRAVNDALTLLFLALKALHRAIELEPNVARRLEYSRVLDRATLLASGAQHCDLAGVHRGGTRADVLAMQQAKTSSAGLFTELGALLGGCDAPDRVRYRRMGECLALIVQICDDLRDVYGKAVSPDLANATSTYPLACLRERASVADQRRFEELRQDLPRSLPEIRQLFYDAGVVQDSAQAMEQFREEIHELVMATGNHSGYHRVLLEVIDGLASAVFVPPRLEISASVVAPEGGWHDQVRCELAAFIRRMQPFCPPPAPGLRPWHLPQWMFRADEQVVFYPDLEDLAAEVLPFQQMLLGISDPSEAERMVRRQLPVILAHEMFHCWRNASGRLTGDHWHEEWVANRLAVAYAHEHCPDVLDLGLGIASRVAERLSEALDAVAASILDSCHEDRSTERRGYGMGLTQTAVVSLEMVRRLAATPPCLSTTVQELLLV
jgi:geranylgeranyl pyrophosphate synthase